MLFISISLKFPADAHGYEAVFAASQANPAQETLIKAFSYKKGKYNSGESDGRNQNAL